MKLFKTNNIDVVKSCQLYFGFSLPSEEWVKRAKNLDMLVKYWNWSCSKNSPY